MTIFAAGFQRITNTLIKQIGNCQENDVGAYKQTNWTCLCDQVNKRLSFSSFIILLIKSALPTHYSSSNVSSQLNLRI